MRKHWILLLCICAGLLFLAGTYKTVTYQINPNQCRSCGRCYLHCSAGAISYNEQIGAFQIDSNACTGCGTCVQYCPYGAISQVVGNADEIIVPPVLLLSCNPNPMSSVAVLNYTLPKVSVAGVLSLFNSKGQLVLQRSIDKTSTSFYWSGVDSRGRVLPAGMYFATLKSGKNRVTCKIIKER
jgi:Pyruvate/2-oxoacid:ferredoxin oxidoreductase delta subunit